MSVVTFDYAEEKLVTVYILQALATSRYGDRKYWAMVPAGVQIPAARRLQKTYRMEDSNRDWDNCYTFRSEADARAIFVALSTARKAMQFRIVKVEPTVVATS